MGVTVPQYENTVKPDVAEVAHPQFAAPNPEAFGTGVAQAMEQAGAKVQASTEQLTSHLIERQNQQREMDVYNAEMGLRDKMNNILNGTNMITVKDANGNDKQMPEGVMNWNRDNAVGSHQNFADRFNTASNDFINSFQTPQQKRLAAYLSQRMYGYGSEMASKHEAMEYKATVIDNGMKSIQSDNALAQGTTKPEDVGYLMNHAAAQMDLMHESQGLKGTSMSKDASDVAKKDVLKANLGGLIQSDPSGLQAQQMFDALKGNLSPASQDEVRKYIQSGIKENQTQVKQQQTESFVNTRIGVFQDLSKMDFRNASGLISTLMPRDPELAKAVQLIVDNKGKYVPTKEEDLDSQAALNTLVKSKDSVGLTNSMIQEFNKNPKMKPSTLATYIQAGINMHKALPFAKDLDSPNDPAQSKVVGGLKAIVGFGNNQKINSSPVVQTYINELNKGVQADQAYLNAMQQYAVSQYPEAATMDTPPNYVIGSDSPIRVIFPRRGKSAATESK